MKGKRNTEKLEAARRELLEIADGLQAVIDGERPQTAVAAEHGMDPNEFSRNLTKKFAPFAKKRLIGIEDMTPLLIAQLTPGQRLMCMILLGDVPDDVLPVLPEFDEETLWDAAESLTPREEKVLKMACGYGKYERPRTVDEIGREYNVTHERIRQIRAKALRKMRHPSRLKRVFPMLNDIGRQTVEASENALRSAEQALAGALRDLARAKRLEDVARALSDESADPAEAARQACAVLARHGDPEPAPVNAEAMAMPVEEMDLSVRSYNCIRRAGIATVGDIVARGLDGMYAVPNLSRKCLDEIDEKLVRFAGISLFA